MLDEYKNILTAMITDANNLAVITDQNRDPYGGLDFEKLEELGLMNDYKEAARLTSESRLKVKIFEEFLKERGGFVDEKEKDAVGLDLQSRIEKAKSDEKFTLANNANPMKRDDKGNIIPTQKFITVGDKSYDVTDKGLDEQVEIYRNALEEKLQEKVGKNMSSEQKEQQIQKLCSEIYKCRNDIVGPLLVSDSKSR